MQTAKVHIVCGVMWCVTYKLKPKREILIYLSRDRTIDRRSDTIITLYISLSGSLIV